MKKFRRNLTSILLYACATTAAYPDSSSTNICNTVWKKQSLDFSEASDKNTLTVFIGEDGEIFNCLNYVVDEKSLQIIRDFSIEIARINSRRPLDERGLIVGLCGRSVTNVEQKPVIGISLPYDTSTLNSHACQNSLSGTLKRMRSIKDGQ